MRSKALVFFLSAYLLSLLHLSVFPASAQMQDALFEPDAAGTDQGEFIDLGAEGIDSLLDPSAFTEDPYGTFDQTRSPLPLPLSEYQTSHFGLYSSQQSQVSSEDEESGSPALRVHGEKICMAPMIELIDILGGQERIVTKV